MINKYVFEVKDMLFGDTSGLLTECRQESKDREREREGERNDDMWQRITGQDLNLDQLQ